MNLSKIRQAMQKYEPYTGILKDIAFGILIWFFLTTTVGEARVVPTVSMVPTIKVGDRIWTDKVMLHFRDVQRGDIVVFDTPFKAADPYVKRVIGLPGESIEVKNGKVWVNGKSLDEPYIAEAPFYHYGPIQIPEGQYLMLGDNRNNSYDGHYWGFVNRSAILARAVYRFWPPSRIGPLR